MELEYYKGKGSEHDIGDYRSVIGDWRKRIYKDMCEVVSDKVICIYEINQSNWQTRMSGLNVIYLEAKVDTLIETLTKEKKIEKLIHCAGVMETRAAAKIDYKLAERMFNINITAPLQSQAD